MIDASFVIVQDPDVLRRKKESEQAREKDGDKVVVILNLSAENQEVKLQGADHVGAYNNIFAKGTTTLTEDMMMNLKPWDYVVLSNK